MSVIGRLCCKSRKLQGYEFFAKIQHGQQSPIRITSIALPKSHVSFMRGDEAPHIFTRKPRLQPAEFLITTAKRLLQHNRHLADKRSPPSLSVLGGIADMAKAAAMSEADISRRFMLAARSESQLYQNILLEPVRCSLLGSCRVAR